MNPSAVCHREHLAVWRRYAHHLKVKGLAKDYHNAVLGTRAEIAGSWFLGPDTLARDLEQLSRLDDVKDRDYVQDVMYVNPNGVYFPLDFKGTWLPNDNLLVNRKQPGVSYVLLTLQRNSSFNIDDERDVYFDIRGYCPWDALQPARGRFGGTQYFCPYDKLIPIERLFLAGSKPNIDH